MTMNIGLLTTLDTNIGDDFIRVGIQNIISRCLSNHSINWVKINKHEPHSVWPCWHPNHWLRHRRLGGVRRALSSQHHAFSKCDLVIQCGAPVLWENCGWCDWNQPVWQEVLIPMSKAGVPVANIAIGAAYPLDKQPLALESSVDREYLTDILSCCRLTTARDPLVKHLVAALGFDVPVIPCSAGLAAPERSNRGCGDIVAFNYMVSAGHYDFSNNIDEERWEKTFKDIVSHFQKNYKVVMLCHDENERKLVQGLWPDVDIFLPKNHEEYFEFSDSCNIGIFNRMHASVAFAGNGIPSVAVGNDTRLLMVKEYGLPCFGVHEATATKIIEAAERLIESRLTEQQRLLNLREQTISQYEECMGRMLAEAVSV